MRAALLPLVAGTLLALLVVGPVLADVELASSDPEADATLLVPPTTITLVFSGPLVPGKSSFTVEGPGGEVGTGRVSADDRTVMALDGLDLAPGDYEIRWTAGSEDGHIVRDTLAFTVLEPTPPPATPTPAPTAAPSAAPTAAPTASAAPTAVPEPSSDSGSDTPTASTADVVLPIVAGLVLVGVVGFLVLRRRAA